MTTPTRSLEARADVLEHTQRHWQQRRQAGQAGAAPAASVALMREAGTPGTSLAREVGARLGLTRQAAARWVEQTERDRTRFVRDYFLKDPTDPHHYDLTLNTSRWSVPECADLIVEAVRRVEARLARA